MSKIEQTCPNKYGKIRFYKVKENYFERVMKAKFLEKDKFVCLRPFGNMKEALLDLGPGVQEVLKIALKVTLF